MTGQTYGPADMPAFGTLLAIDPIVMTGATSVQATMTSFGTLPGAAPTPVIPAPGPNADLKLPAPR
ncbi:hypothetical protein H5J25_13640 [Sphingomonas aliaeris]|uniref:Uncharacterized protein n=1 Tax=Sphingomonas aliaeris TaxID=2759526 RepID=A0A974NTC1_9SPHN|nr:hypothetical protein [Sphingomonas aliaeris]QQV76491.1 hypothetical protein H5J25_13640 [Sphingomonas aliaeris]